MKEFLRLLYEDKSPDHWVLLWTKAANGKKTSYWVKDLAALPTLPEDLDIYVGCGLAPRAGTESSRCFAHQIAGIPGLWIDLDYAGAGVHQKANLPPTLEDALGLLKAIPHSPSLIVHSGNGVHCWWLWKEIWEFDSPEDRTEAAAMVRRLQHAIREEAKPRGWAVDFTADLSRVLRVPGTLNHKSDPPKPVSLAENTGARYNPWDFDDCLPADPGPPATLTNEDKIRAGDLILDPQAEPPWEKLAALGSNEPRFLATWERNREDMQDQSPSSYDMSLANFAVLAQWTDQEICNLIIAWRRKHQEEPAKAMRPDYLARTIARARQDLAARRADETLATHTALRGSDIVATPEAREELRQAISTKMGLEIGRIAKWMGDPPEYFLETPLGSIQLGEVGQLIGQAALRKQIAAATGILIPPFAKDEWHALAQQLLDLCEKEDAGPEATEQGRLEVWVREYLEHNQPTEEWRQAAVGSQPFSRDGAVWLFAAHFKRWIAVRQFENLAPLKLGRLLRQAGFQHKRMHFALEGKDTTKSVWGRAEKKDQANEED